MFCSKCGNQNADGIPFCAHCGAPLNAAPQPPVYPNPYGQAPIVPGKGMGVAGMVLGIIALVLFCYWVVSIPCALIGVALSGIASSKAKAAGMNNGTATAGIAMCCVALGLAILYLIFIGALLAEMGIAIGMLD